MLGRDKSTHSLGHGGNIAGVPALLCCSASAGLSRLTFARPQRTKARQSVSNIICTNLYVFTTKEECCYEHWRMGEVSNPKLKMKALREKYTPNRAVEQFLPTKHR